MIITVLLFVLGDVTHEQHLMNRSRLKTFGYIDWNIGV